MRRILALCAALTLSGCAGSPLTMPFLHDAPPPEVQKPVIKTVVHQVCLKWNEWSDADRLALHDALVPIPDGSPIIKAVREFDRYYKDDKACLDAQK